MSKKFKIKDGEDEIIVEEMEEKPGEVKKPEEQSTHDADFTSEEISALKELAKAAPAIVALVKQPGTGSGSGSETHDGEETEEEKKAREAAEAARKAEEAAKAEAEAKQKAAAVADSAEGFGSVEIKDSKVEVFDAEKNSIEIEEAWTKRYGGIK